MEDRIKNYDPYEPWYKEYEDTSSEQVFISTSSISNRTNNFYQNLMDKWESLERNENKKGENETMTKIPVIKDVNILVENKVVEVAFEDKTKEKAVCLEPDTFDLERAISICLAKKVMGGSSAYNNAVKKGLKVYDNKIKQEAADKKEKERIEKKRAKLKAYKQRRKERKVAEENERQIEIQKEAYIRAMKKLKK